LTNIPAQFDGFYQWKKISKDFFSQEGQSGDFYAASTFLKFKSFHSGL